MAEAQGFDVSQYQSGVYSGGGGFLFGLAKLTEGVGYKDPSADRHMAALLAQPIVPGGYHFARPDLNPGQSGAYAEADWFWRVAISYGGARGMLLADDQEVGIGPMGVWRDDFCGRLAWRLNGYAAGWYSYWSFIGTRALNYGAPYWAWLAWPDANGALPSPNFAISMQQYGLTTVPGIAGQVDANRFFGSVAQLRALTVGAPAPDPTPPPAPTQEDPDMGDIVYIDAPELKQQHTYYVDARGVLWLGVYDETTKASVLASLATDPLAPRAPVTVRIADDLEQVQLRVRCADGRVCVGVAPFGEGWTFSYLGAPDGGLPAVVDPGALATAVVGAVLGHLPASVDEAKLTADLTAALLAALPGADEAAIQAGLAKALSA